MSRPRLRPLKNYYKMDALLPLEREEEKKSERCSFESSQELHISEDNKSKPTALIEKPPAFTHGPECFTDLFFLLGGGMADIWNRFFFFKQQILVSVSVHCKFDKICSLKV